MGRETDDAARLSRLDDHYAASRRLRLLEENFLEHPSAGPSERRSPTVKASAPLNLDLVDFFAASVAEIVQHTMDAAPQTPDAVPARAAEVIEWCRQNTEEASPEARLRGDIKIKHLEMEAAVRAGDTDIVCRQPCPRCTTWGLQWRSFTQRAVCTNEECQDRQGMSSTWTLARLATQYVMEKETLKICAT